MENWSGKGYAGLWLLLVIISVIVIISRSAKKKAIRRLDAEQQLEFLKKAYDIALKKGDKANALKAGREYYSALRNGLLTVYDEQAIANDLATMKTY